jgi:Spy/CpxP family protein refolding chaperone
MCGFVLFHWYPCHSTQFRLFISRSLLFPQVEEVQRQQAQLKEDRKKRIAEKLKRAEENRKSYIRGIQRKAHDEEEKLREIAFINNLEAQNKRHDFIASCQVCTYSYNF